MIRSKLFREARNLGFVHIKRLRNVVKGKVYRDDEIFLAEHGSRQLHLVIGRDGKGTVAHSNQDTSWTAPAGSRILNPAPPTSFKDLPGMYRAIAFEWQRTTMQEPKVEQAATQSAVPAASPQAWSKPE